MTELDKKLQLFAENYILARNDENLDRMKNWMNRIKSLIKEVCEEVIGKYEKGEIVQVPCPDRKPGCLVFHTGEMMTDRIENRNELKSEQREKLNEILGEQNTA